MPYKIPTVFKSLSIKMLKSSGGGYKQNPNGKPTDLSQRPRSRTCLASIEVVESFWLAAMLMLSIAPLK